MPGQEHEAKQLPKWCGDQESLHDPMQVSELIPAQPQNQHPEGHT